MPNDYVEAAKRIAAAIEAEASAMGDVSFARSIWKAVAPLLPRLGGRPPIPQGAPAEVGWKARLMLFDHLGELQADSMPDAPAEAEPAEFFGTLGHVASWLRTAAADFHEENRDGELVGLDAATLERSILSLRVSLSRNGGATWWRVAYTAGGTSWRAAVRVERASA